MAHKLKAQKRMAMELMKVGMVLRNFFFFVFDFLFQRSSWCLAQSQ